MKLTKKILVAVLAIACLASCLLFSSFADDQTQEPANPFEGILGISKVDDILEYYACDEYLADGYDDGVFTEEYFNYDDFLAYVDILGDPAGASNDVFLNHLYMDGISAYARTSADGSAWTEKLFLTFDIYFDENCQKNVYYEVALAAEGKNSPDPILRIDFRPFDDAYAFDPTIKRFFGGDDGNTYQPYVSYAEWNANTGYFSSSVVKANAYGTEETFIPETGKWYSVEVSYNAEDEVCFFTISEGETIVVEQRLDIPGAHGVKGFECKATHDRWGDDALFFDSWGEDNEDDWAAFDEAWAAESDIYLDNMEIYEGSYTRYPAQREEITSQTLLVLEQLYLDPATSREDKVVIADVIYKLYNGETDEDGDVIIRAIEDELKSAVPNAEKYFNETFANEIVLRVADIDTNGNYYERMAYLADEFVDFNRRLPEGAALTGMPGITPEIEALVNEARAVYETEIALLAEIKDNSEAFIAAMADYEAQESNDQYDYIVATYNDGVSDKYAKKDNEYEGVAAANAILERLVFKYNRMISDIEAFVDIVSDMHKAETDRHFGELYDAYQLAYKAYHKYEDSYAGSKVNPDVDVVSNHELANAVVFFESNEAYILDVAAQCDAFNNIVLQANMASYYPTFREILDEVPAKLALVWGEEHDLEAAIDGTLVLTDAFNYRADYKNVGESYATYLALVNSITDIETASASYVAAVEAIATAEGFYAKKAAVLAALELKAAGDNLAVTGVKEANLALTAAKAEIDQQEGNSITFISIIDMLEDAKTLAERKAIILSARAVIDGIASDYNGIADAVAAYNAAVEAYEADVAAINGALASAVGNIVTLI